MHKKNHYAEEGVRNAVRAFRAKGLSVVVVSKRRCTVDMFKEDGEVKVVIADKTDDALLLKHAQILSAPVVSMENFNGMTICGSPQRYALGGGTAGRGCKCGTPGASPEISWRILNSKGP